jgi:putative membrane protein
MPGFLLRLLVGAFGLWVASALVPGVQIDGVGTLFLAAFLLGFVNAFVRPVAILLTLPLTIVSLGLFLLVINAGMLWLVASFMSGFHVAGFGSALLGSIVVSVTSWLASWYIGPRGRVEILIVERDAR